MEVGRRSCHSSCLHNNQYNFRQIDSIYTEVTIATQTEFTVICSLTLLLIQNGKKFNRKDNFQDPAIHILQLFITRRY
jgi:hypothetical protein